MLLDNLKIKFDCAYTSLQRGLSDIRADIDSLVFTRLTALVPFDTYMIVLSPIAYNELAKQLGSQASYFCCFVDNDIGSYPAIRFRSIQDVITVLRDPKVDTHGIYLIDYNKKQASEKSLFCQHEFKTYVGFTDSFDYCTRCNERR